MVISYIMGLFLFVSERRLALGSKMCTNSHGNQEECQTQAKTQEVQTQQTTALILHPKIDVRAAPRGRLPQYGVETNSNFGTYSPHLYHENCNFLDHNRHHPTVNYYPVAALPKSKLINLYTPPVAPAAAPSSVNLNYQSKQDWLTNLKMPPLTKPPPSLTNTSVIEGTGPYLCILRASSELNSGVTSIFVRDVGFYHCSFQQARRIKLMVLGAGFYHCIYQRPGSQINVRQGVGQYFCFFQGIRFARNFVIPPPPEMGQPPPPMEKRNFLEFLASINYKIFKGQTTPLGQFQLLGIYTYGPEGSNRNFGLLQATENFNIDLESLTTTPGKEEKPVKNSNVGVNQLGQYQYHFNGADVDEGRADQFENFAYNFVHTFGNPVGHSVTFLVTQYNFEGQGKSLIDDQDFVQLWGLYEYDFDVNLNFDPKKVTMAPATVQQLPGYLKLIIMTQHDLTRFTNFIGENSNFLDGDGFDFLQLIFQYSEPFAGWGPSDTGSLTVTLAYQGNYDEETRILTTKEGVMATDFLLGIFQLRYSFVGEEHPGVAGFVQFYAIYQHQLKEDDERAPGYFQILGQYSRTYSDIILPPHFLGHSIHSAFTWTVQGIAEYVFPDEELSNGFVKLQCQYQVDTSDWLSEEGRPSSVTLIGLYQCIWFGKRVMIKTFCYVQLYAFYQADFGLKVNELSGGVNGVSGDDGGGQTVLLVQFYQEV